MREAAVDHGAPAPAADDSDAIRRAIAKLPERQRLAVFLRYYADLDYAGIAAVLRVREGTVGALLSQAREAVARSIEELT